MPDSAIAAVAELAAHSHSVITRSQAAQHLSRRRITTAIAQGWLTEPYHGVLCIAGAVATFEHRLRAATLAIGERSVASHRSAARLHALDGWESSPTIEVSTDREHRWQFDNGVVAHHVTPFASIDLTEIDGIAVTTLARTLADLGSVVPTDEVERAVTSARRRGCSIAWLRRTADRLDRPGQSGTARLLRVLDAIPFEGRVPESWFETILARCLDHPRLPQVIPQYVIRDREGAFIGRVDLAFPHVRLAIEAHSKQFHFGPQPEAADADRDLRLAAAGWEVLYLGWHATKQPAEIVALVERVIAARTIQVA